MGARPVGDEFELFWRCYPRKKSKEDARKAWRQTASVRPKIESLLLAVDQAKVEWERRDIRYCPYPATWLRAHGWEDEPDPEPVFGGQRELWSDYLGANRMKTPEQLQREEEEYRRLEERIRQEDLERQQRKRGGQ